MYAWARVSPPEGHGIDGIAIIVRVFHFYAAQRGRAAGRSARGAVKQIPLAGTRVTLEVVKPAAGTTQQSDQERHIVVLPFPCARRVALLILCVPAKPAGSAAR
jgi:hypothetical protein